VIGAGQRAEVRAALAAEPGLSAEELSERLILPLWSVKRRLAELEGVG
jgi:predicted ArsR family transcriptional regulator